MTRLESLGLNSGNSAIGAVQDTKILRTCKALIRLRSKAGFGKAEPHHDKELSVVDLRAFPFH